jgi:hypothetical protein
LWKSKVKPLKGTTLKNKLFAQVTVALSGAAVIAAGTAMPVMADPVSVNKYAELVGLGSDTTMDVMDGISLALGNVSDSDTRLKLASYKALGSADVVVSADGIAIPRANGSSAGRDALRIAIGQINSGSVAIAPDELGKARTATSPTTSQLAGKVHYARSSSGPSGAVTNGVVTYVPFAQDNLTYATAPLNITKIPSDIPVGTAANTSEVSLMNIYKGNITQVITDEATGDFLRLSAPLCTSPGLPLGCYELAAGEVANTIRAYVPQAGSGTRSFWNTTVGITDAGITAGTFPAKDVTPAGVTVQEHDGTAVASDPYALVGFSISQWVAQTNGVAPKRTAGAILRSIGGLEPTVVTDGVYATAPTWSAIKRSVYNIVPTALVNADEENAYTRAFRGSNSLVCQSQAVILKFGYGLLSYTGEDVEIGETPGGEKTHCGNITAANRVYAPAASTVTLADPDVASNGSSATVTATVTSNGDQGGTVSLISGFGTDDAAEVASGVVPKGATTVNITVTNTTAEAFEKTVTAQFVPTLSGVGVSTSTATKTITLAAPAAVKTATSVSFGAATVASNGLSATFTATITGGVNGNLNIYNNNFTGAILKTVAVTGGTATVTIDQAKGEKVSYNLVGEFVPTDTATAETSRTTAGVAVALRNTSYSLITVGASYKTSALPTVSVTIKAGKVTSSVGAKGTVFAVVYNSKKVPVQVSSALVTLSATGTATLKFAKITTVGTYTVKVFYGGSAEVAASTTTKTFKVVK